MYARMTVACRVSELAMVTQVRTRSTSSPNEFPWPVFPGPLGWGSREAAGRHGFADDPGVNLAGVLGRRGAWVEGCWAAGALGLRGAIASAGTRLAGSAAAGLDQATVPIHRPSALEGR